MKISRERGRTHITRENERRERKRERERDTQRKEGRERNKERKREERTITEERVLRESDAAKSARIAHQNIHLDPSRVMRETTEEKRTKTLTRKTTKTAPTLPPTAVGSHQSTSASSNSTTQAAP